MRCFVGLVTLLLFDCLQHGTEAVGKPYTRVMITGSRHSATSSLSAILFAIDPRAWYVFEPDHEISELYQQAPPPGVIADLYEMLWCNMSAWLSRGGFSSRDFGKNGNSGNGSQYCTCSFPDAHCSGFSHRDDANCDTVESCQRARDLCLAHKIAAVKTINMDDHLGELFSEFCDRDDFAVVHIIRDIRSLAGSWKKDYLGAAKCNDSASGQTKLFERLGALAQKYDVQRDDFRTFRLQPNSTTDRQRCAMRYIRVDQKILSENAFATADRVRQLLNLPPLSANKITQLLEHKLHHYGQCSSHVDKRMSALGTFNPYNRTHATNTHGQQSCPRLMDFIAKRFRFPFLSETRFGVQNLDLYRPE